MQAGQKVVLPGAGYSSTVDLRQQFSQMQRAFVWPFRDHPHLDTFLAADNFAKRLWTLKGRTVYEIINKC